LSFNPAKEAGSVTTGLQLEPFGKLVLTLTHNAPKRTQTCQSSQTVTQPVAVHGVLIFDTHSVGTQRWGRIGTTRKISFSGKSVVVYQLGTYAYCGPVGPPPCAVNTTWGAGNHEVSLDGTIATVNGKVAGRILAQRSASLAKPANAHRYDSVSAGENNMSFTVSSIGVATVHVGPGGPVAGSLTITSEDDGFTYFGTCGTPGKSDLTHQWQSNLVNGSKPFAVQEQIEGPMTIHNDIATIQQVTLPG
jgi:hypothetical protein